MKVFHEAVQGIDPSDRQPWKSPNVAFAPQYLLTLFGKAEADGAVSQRVLLARYDSSGGALRQMYTCPLVIDPRKQSCEVLNQELPLDYRVFSNPTCSYAVATPPGPAGKGTSPCMTRLVRNGQGGSAPFPRP